MILSTLQIKNFKKVRDVTLELGDLTILVGVNGSGKSSIIQATHLACCMTRQADRVDQSRTSTVGVDQLDYLPTDSYKMLGHGIAWGNQEGSPCSEVRMTFAQAAGPVVATCKLRSARNAGISISGSIPLALTDLLRNKSRFFSAYIPGISGIPNKEEKRSKKVVLKACSFGDSNIILRNVLLLLQLQDPGNIGVIEGWINDIIGPIKIALTHDDERDLTIACRVTIDNDERPLELIGTGYLQLIQIFSYILLFKPGILLIDEPDIHLHPSIQERLLSVLAKAAKQTKLRIILTTHSPFLVRGAPADAKVYWLNDGVVHSDKREVVELGLGWGAFGKKVLLLSEDSDTSLLRQLIAQWPDLDRLVAVWPGMGFKQLPSPDQAAAVAKALGGKFKILVHRDRDALTDAEVTTLSGTYAARGVALWCTRDSDVEAYFCEPDVIAAISGCTVADGANYVSSVLTTHATDIDAQFASLRASHNQELHAAGGSPSNADVRLALQTRALRGAKGKFVLGKLMATVPGGKLTAQSVRLPHPVGNGGPDLKVTLESLI